MMNNLTVVLGEDDDGPAMVIRKGRQRLGLTRPHVRPSDAAEVRDCCAARDRQACAASVPSSPHVPVAQFSEDWRRG